MTADLHLETHLPLLLDLLLKSTLIVSLAALLIAVFRRASAANRHTIAVASLVTLLVLPFTKLAPPRFSVTLKHDAPAARATIALPPLGPATPEGDVGTAVAVPESVPAKTARTAEVGVNWFATGVAVWLAGVGFLLARRVGVGVRLRSLAGASRAVDDPRVLAISQELATECGVRAEIRESETCRVPLTFGAWRHIVLLPCEATGWSDERLSAALRHEFGHISRRDCLTRWFADLACALYWMNPLVWFGARSLRLLQEQACDDLVLNAGTPPDDYATQLVEAVRGLQGNHLAANHALAMAQRSTLETRVLAIVDATRDRGPRNAKATVVACLSATFTLATCFVAQVRGADPDRASAAIERGLAFLASRQNHDGSVGATDFRGGVGVSSLAGLAWMGDETYKRHTEGVAKFLLACQRDDGYIVGPAPRIGSMYDHGFATLFLAEYFKATSRADVKDGLAKAVALIVKSQGKGGGWRYQPMPLDGDTSVSACQLMALAAAKDAGVDVPAATFNAGVGFLKNCQNPDGGFGYVGHENSAFPRSAAALSASLATVKWTDLASQPSTTKGSDYVMGFLPPLKADPKGVFFIHGHYYAGQALRRVGGDPWNRWRDAIGEYLLASQLEDGTWIEKTTAISVELATSEACLILQTRRSVPTK